MKLSRKTEGKGLAVNRFQYFLLLWLVQYELQAQTGTGNI